MLSSNDADYSLSFALATGSVSAVMNNANIQEALFLTYLDKIDNECSTLCQSGVENLSLFRVVNMQSLPCFKWSSFITELQEKAPLLLQIISRMCSHSDYRNKFKCGEAHNPGICMATVVILNERNKHMMGVQSKISLILFMACVEKQVCTYKF